MASFEVKIPWRTQPPEGHRKIDWGHPLTRGLQFLWVPGDRRGGDFYGNDLVSGIEAVGVNDAADDFPLDHDVPGEIMRVSDSHNYGDTNYLRWNTNIPLSDTDQCTVATLMRASDTGSWRSIWGIRSNLLSDSAGIELLLYYSDGGGDNTPGLYGPNATNNRSSQSQLVQDEWTMVGAYYDAAAGEEGIYFDGRDAGLQSGNITGTYTDAVRVELFGEARWTNTGDSSVGIHAIWNRTLSPEEHLAFAENPWQIFQPRIMHFPIAPAATTVSQGLFPVKREWTTQPPPGTAIRQDGIGRGLVYAKNFADMHAPDEVSASAPTIVDFAQGYAIDPVRGDVRYIDTTGASGDYFDSGFDRDWASGDDISVAVLYRTTDTSGTLIAQRDGNPTDWQLYIDGASLQWRVGTTNQGDNYSDLSDGEWHTAGVSATLGTNVRHFRDGFTDGNDTHTTGVPNGTNIPLSVGHRWNSYPTNAFQLDGDFAFAGVWDRRLTDDEHVQIHANPWQVYEPRTIWLPFEQLTAAEQAQFVVPIKRRRTQKPRHYVPVDNSHPLAKHVQCFYMFTDDDGADGKTIYDAGPYRHHLEIGGGAVQSTFANIKGPINLANEIAPHLQTNQHLSMTGNATTDYRATAAHTPSYDSNEPFVAMARVGASVSSINLAVIFSIPTTNVTGSSHMMLDTANGRGSLGWSSGNTSAGVDAIDDGLAFNNDLDVVRDYAVTFNGGDPTSASDYDMITDGVSYTPVAAAAYPADGDTFLKLRRHSGGFVFSGDMHYVLFLSDINLSRDEVRRLQENPWQLLEPETVWVPLGQAAESGTDPVITSRTLTDTLTLMDFLIALRERNRQTSDYADITDGSNPERERNRQQQDSVEVTDTPLPTRTRIRETLDAIDVLDFSVVLRERYRTLLDEIELSDATSAQRFRFRTLLNTIQLVDSIVATYVSGSGGTISSRTLTDFISVNDFNVMLRHRVRELTNFLSVTDSALPTRERNRVVSDTIEDIVDSLFATRVRMQQDLDSVDVTDDSTHVIERRRALSDFISVVDFLETQRNRYRRVTDTTDVVDVIIALYITEVLNPLVTHGIEILDIAHEIEKLYILMGVEQEDIDLDLENEVG